MASWFAKYASVASVDLAPLLQDLWDSQRYVCHFPGNFPGNVAHGPWPMAMAMAGALSCSGWSRGAGAGWISRPRRSLKPALVARKARKVKSIEGGELGNRGKCSEISEADVRLM